MVWGREAVSAEYKNKCKNKRGYLIYKLPVEFNRKPVRAGTFRALHFTRRSSNFLKCYTLFQLEVGGGDNTRDSNGAEKRIKI